MSISPQLEFQFISSLEPVFDMLSHKKQNMAKSEWREFVISTKACIIANPEQFLGPSLASHGMLVGCVEQVFETLIDDKTLVSNEIK